MGSAAVGDAAAAPSAAGWYGKLPALGDFASRRLPAAFIDPWDAWLQRSIRATRDRLHAAWTELYLTFPVWRFVAPPGLLGATGWTGILLPSADRVGRCFPMTVAFALAPDDFCRTALTTIDRSLDVLTEAALCALDGGDPQAFDRRVLAAPGPSVDGDATWPFDAERTASLPAVEFTDTLAELLARSASRRLLAALPGPLWWLPPGDDASGLAFVAAGLDAGAFERLLRAGQERPTP